ncbi:hypothetical protein [Gimesia fumaroli]|uniref:SIR2-like domain-containing protein n=1 Tax=Gimesia fumaroli TaxID=2527976 RepID=A0A518ID19_9PLAN|nr:hypothetical protein [Gimesia fumaroli]QDV51003.1 hypothetical protein Enr17x_30540 [Gimesia fumaroli]
MLKYKTCLLLGAGASQHLDFPLGFKLKQDMLAELARLRKLSSEDLPDVYKTNDFDKNKINKLYKGLLYSDCPSPDVFLEKNPEYMKIGKYLICLKLVEYEIEDKFITHAGWYEQLRSALKVDSPEKLKDNRLSIVTFNYDRSLDAWLHQYIENEFRLSSDEAWKIFNESIEIVHVHGVLGKYPDFTYGDKNKIFKRSQSIKIVSEADSQQEEFEKASRLLKNSERVIVFGFGFATENVERLDYFEKKELEERKVLIAAGPFTGGAARDALDEWLGQWGLIRGRHFYQVTANEIFSSHRNPFSNTN